MGKFNGGSQLMRICKWCGCEHTRPKSDSCLKCSKSIYGVSHRTQANKACKRYREAHQDKVRQTNKNYRNTNHKKVLDWAENQRRKSGIKPAEENKKCPAFLGIHVAERVLSKVFEGVKTMPPNNKGYDFICNKGKKIDVKSACTHKTRDSWLFHIFKNKIADYFLCIAFDNRVDITPLHIWLVPADAVNDKTGVTISKSTISKWDEYKLDIDKVTACCDIMKQSNK